MAASKKKPEKADLYLDEQNKFKEGNPGNPLATGRPILLPAEIVNIRKQMGGEFVKHLDTFLHMNAYEFEAQKNNAGHSVIERIVIKFVEDAMTHAEPAYIKLLAGMCGVSTETKNVVHSDPVGGGLKSLSIGDIVLALQKDQFMDLVPKEKVINAKEGESWSKSPKLTKK